MRIARRALPDVVLVAHIHAYHTSSMEDVWPALDHYIMSASRQWILMQLGDFDGARQLDFDEVSPGFDMMQHKIQVAMDNENRWGQSVARTSRNEMLLAGILAAAATLLLYLRLQRRDHISQLESTFRDGQERFRALTEQSADIILIADSAGQIQYVSPSSQPILAFHEETFVGKNLRDLVHPDDRPENWSMTATVTQLGTFSSKKSAAALLRACGAMAQSQGWVETNLRFLWKT
jgi:PAS domain S-box-containing protein